MCSLINLSVDMAKKTLKVAAIQTGCSGDVEANIAHVAKFIKYAAKRGAELVAICELGLYPWFCAEIDESAFEMAESTDGAAVARLRELAKNAGVAIVAPLFEKDGDSYYNSMIAIDDSGDIVHTYRQVHVPQLVGWEERSYFQSGSSLEPFELCGWKIGIQTGWDNFFPEGARTLALCGAELIIAPTASGSNSKDLWERAISANAMFNGVYALRVNRTGKEGDIRFYGSSFCVDPLGDFTAGPLGEAEGVLICELDRSAIMWARKMWPFFDDRRPGAYSKISEVDDER